MTNFPDNSSRLTSSSKGSTRVICSLAKNVYNNQVSTIRARNILDNYDTAP